MNDRRRVDVDGRNAGDVECCHEEVGRQALAAGEDEVEDARTDGGGIA
jgi:hypothetical protein